MFRKLILLTPLFLSADLQPARAVEYCAEFFDGQRRCGIPTYQSCLRTVSGVGGECIEDQFGAIPKGLMEQLMEKRRQEWQPTPPAVRDLEAVPAPPQ
jgi:hypothetical protein